MAKGLKSFLDDWGEIHPEDVVVIDEPVSVKYGVAALQHKLESQGLFPVIVCETADHSRRKDQPVSTRVQSARQPQAMRRIHRHPA